MSDLIKEAVDFARKHPIDFAIEVATAFCLVWGGVFLVALAGN